MSTKNESFYDATMRSSVFPSQPAPAPVLARAADESGVQPLAPVEAAVVRLEGAFKPVARWNDRRMPAAVCAFVLGIGCGMMLASARPSAPTPVVGLQMSLPAVVEAAVPAGPMCQTAVRYDSDVGTLVQAGQAMTGLWRFGTALFSGIEGARQARLPQR